MPEMNYRNIDFACQDNKPEILKVFKFKNPLQGQGMPGLYVYLKGHLPQMIYILNLASIYTARALNALSTDLKTAIPLFVSSSAMGS